MNGSGTMITTLEINELSGRPFYDETGRMQEAERWHLWPRRGGKGHIAFASCPCGPYLSEDHGESEVWQHREIH
jgi:hypothetical protein